MSFLASSHPYSSKHYNGYCWLLWLQSIILFSIQHNVANLPCESTSCVQVVSKVRGEVTCNVLEVLLRIVAHALSQDGRTSKDRPRPRIKVADRHNILLGLCRWWFKTILRAIKKWIPEHSVRHSLPMTCSFGFFQWRITYSLQRKRMPRSIIIWRYVTFGSKFGISIDNSVQNMNHALHWIHWMRFVQEGRRHKEGWGFRLCLAWIFTKRGGLCRPND